MRSETKAELKTRLDAVNKKLSEVYAKLSAAERELEDLRREKQDRENKKWSERERLREVELMTKAFMLVHHGIDMNARLDDGEERNECQEARVLRLIYNITMPF